MTKLTLRLCCTIIYVVKVRHILFVSFILIHYSRSDLCSYNFTFSDLPHSIVKQVKSFISDGYRSQVTYCKNLEYSENNIMLYLYTRNNNSFPIKLTSRNSNILKGRKTIVLNHGFLCNYQNDLMPELKDAYLERYDANVIIVDWSHYSVDYYTNCYCNLPKVADTVAEFLCKADSESNLDITQLHVIGHSMGGQLAGLIGQNVKDRCNNLLGRITGLDPAGPLYLGSDISKRLDASDAKLVVVIHTNMGMLGYLGTCGTVDFYPNMGIFQEGCSIFNAPTSDVIDVLIYPAACSHLRSVNYFIESIKGHKFVGKRCLLCGVCIPNPTANTYAIMGEDFEADYIPCSYYLDTNSSPPYEKG